jgi:SAM-dependent methyltransferase
MKKRMFLLTIYGFSFCFLFSQDCQRIKGRPGYFYKDMGRLEKQMSGVVKFYDLRPGQAIASIGAQSGNVEASIAALSDSLLFYLEDIDPKTLNDSNVAFAWKYYSELRGKPITCQYKIFIGDEESTNLPEHYFDKILIVNSFHEFSNQKKMLADIRSKLKRDGILFIDEVVARKNGDLHVQCKKRIFTEEEMVAIFKENGFEYTHGMDMSFRKSKPSRKIYAFKKTVD